MNAEQSLLESLLQTLAAQPDVAVRSVARDNVWQGKRRDAVVLADVLARPVRLVVETRNAGFPRDVREAVWQMGTVPEEETGIRTLSLLLAPVLSASSRDWLRDQQIAYADTSGSLYLRLPWALLYVDHSPPAPAQRQTRQLFRGASARVVHALLLEPKKSWHLQKLAQCAQVAVSTAHQVMTTLEAELWVVQQGRGPESVRVLQEPGALLDAWAKEHTLKRYEVQSFFRYAPSPIKLREAVGIALETHRSPYALTQFAGAELSAPFVTSIEQMTFLVPMETTLPPVLEAAKLKPVDSGANVVFWRTKEAAAFLGKRHKEAVWIASDIQIYLDLMASAGRGREQAQHLRRERIGF